MFPLLSLLGFCRTVGGRLLALTAVILCGGGLQADDATASNLPELTVKKCKDFRISGAGDAAAWQSTDWVVLNRRPNGRHDYTARLRMLYSNTGVYVLFDGSDRKLTATMQEDFLDLWNEDVFECFSWTSEDHPVYFEYEISPLGYELPILVPNLDGRFLGWRPWHYEGTKKIRKKVSATGGTNTSLSAVTGRRAEVFIPYELLTPHGGNSKSDVAGGGHAHAGAMIYLGDRWPQQYRNQLFMSNIHGQRLNVDVLKPNGSAYVGSHRPDFLFTGVQASQILNLLYGPDGNAWMIDWYDMQACHRRESTVHDRNNGRIYRISYGDPTKAEKLIDIAGLSDKELAALVLHPNDWYVRHSRRLLRERGPVRKIDASALKTLAAVLTTHTDDTRRLRAAWALHVINRLSPELFDAMHRGCQPVPSKLGHSAAIGVC